MLTASAPELESVRQLVDGEWVWCQRSLLPQHRMTIVGGCLGARGLLGHSVAQQLGARHGHRRRAEGMTLVMRRLMAASLKCDN